MTDYYVMAPISGVITGLDDYCDESGEHHAALLESPRDIDDQPESQTIGFWCWGVQSIRTTRRSSLCSCCGDEGALTDGVQVDMYTEADAGGTCIGSVVYVHVANRVEDGVYNTWTKNIGQVPAGYLEDCYEGTHSHIERSSNGVTRDLYCDQSVCAGTDWIYKFSV